MKPSPSRLAALALLLVTSSAGVSCGRPSPPGPRLLVVGLDGASWKVIGPMLERGELPAFRQLVAQGAYAPQFEVVAMGDGNVESPVAWTSLATGRLPQDHGVLGFTTTLPNGQRIPATSNLRRARAIWEVASEVGVSVGVIGWWATWPAERVRGYMVSDHANPAFGEFLFADRRYWTADPAGLSRLQHDVFPADIAPILARHWLRKEDFPYADLQRRGGFTDPQIKVLRAAPWDRRQVYSWLKTFYRIDDPLFEVALDLQRERPVELQMLYLRGPDPVQHYGWDLVEPEKFAVAPPQLARDRGLIEGVYRYLDSFLGELLRRQRRDAWTLVLSDHGAEPSSAARDPAHLSRPGEHTLSAKGVLFLAGPHVLAGRVLEKAGPYDVAPTIAWLLGLPLSAELPGRPLLAAFDSSFASGRAVRRVPSYGARETGPLLASPEDQEMLKSLRNLGYIQ